MLTYGYVTLNYVRNACMCIKYYCNLFLENTIVILWCVEHGTLVLDCLHRMVQQAKGVVAVRLSGFNILFCSIVGNYCFHNKKTLNKNTSYIFVHSPK